MSIISAHREMRKKDLKYEARLNCRVRSWEKREIIRKRKGGNKERQEGKEVKTGKQYTSRQSQFIGSYFQLIKLLLKNWF